MDNVDLRREAAVLSLFNAKSIQTRHSEDTAVDSNIVQVLRDLRMGEKDLPSMLRRYDSAWAIAMVKNAFADEKLLGINLKDAAYKAHVGDVAVQRLQEDLSSTLIHALGRIHGVQVAFREMGVTFEGNHRDAVANGLYTYFADATRSTNECINDIAGKIDFLLERTDYGMEYPHTLLPHIRFNR